MENITRLPASKVIAKSRARTFLSLQWCTAIRRAGFSSWVVLTLLTLALASSAIAAAGEWEYTGSLHTARGGHKASLLADGRVLIAGGSSNRHYFASAELYDPVAGSWTLTGNLNLARTAHTMTLLATGKVLVAGGVWGQDITDFTNTAELYDPMTGTWSYTGSLNSARYWHTATLLTDGKVLVAGGLAYPDGALSSAELYDPLTNTWTVTGSLNAARFNHTATLLSDGRVLLAGGSDGAKLKSSELYDPTTGNWTLTGNLHNARDSHTATLLTDGRVLIAGGSNPSGQALGSAELYDPARGTWAFTGNLLSRYGHSANLLADGTVLVAGGDCTGDHCVDGYTASAQLYIPARGIWLDTGSFNTARSGHTATLLANRELLAAAGANADGDLTSAELYGITVPSEVTGRGEIVVNGGGDRATFNFRAKQSGDQVIGSFSFEDPTAAVSISEGKFRTLTFGEKSADLRGIARLGDGTRVNFHCIVYDNVSARGVDTFSLILSNGYSASGTLTSGYIKIQ